MLKSKGRLGLAALACVGLAIAISTPAAAWDRESGSVQNFLLPPGAPMVEGLTVDSNGNVYTSTFNPTGPKPSQLFIFGPGGGTPKSVTISGSSNAMLGLAFRPGTDELLVIDFGMSQVLSVNPNLQTNNAQPCITLPGSSLTGGPTAAGAGLNGITFDAAGTIYVSDSFQGIIWRFSPKESRAPCGTAAPWFPANSLLMPGNGVPGFGANGIEFNNEQNAMFVCNTATDWIVKIPVSGGTPGKGGTAGTPEVFTNSINGCDGLAIDSSDNIWAAANQADEIVVVDPTGKVIAKLGDFDGVDGGATKGLLFPASPAFSPDGKFLWVTNLELDLRTITPHAPPNPDGVQTVDSQWAAEVTRHSIAKLPVPATFPFFGP
ncbi:MAG: SMP-30/gluconolactonase/LRE family protein [Xanthobacteraceae bacterium]|jgi:DNA-binding beta-propeller fold protein YncE